MNRERIEQLIALLKRSTSTELAVREGDDYVRVRRAPMVPPAPAAPAVVAASVSAGAAAQVPTAPPDGEVTVCSKLVGRFYRGKGPGQPPLVNIGDRVEAGQIIATLEALGKLTAVPAPQTGDVVQVIAQDGQAVHYGAPLLRIKTA